MVDSPRSSLANIFEYFWTLVLAFFVGQSTSKRSELPLSRAEAQQSPRSSEHMIEKGHSEKEQFLRHPSIRSNKRKGRQKNTISETRSGRYSIFPSGPSIQFLNSFIHRPRSGSTTVPVVIITPSSPTRDKFPAAELLLPSLSSPFELADSTVEPAHQVPISVISKDTGEVSLASDKQVSVPPDVENDISDIIEFDSWTIPTEQASQIDGEAAAEPSFFLPESLQKVTFEPIRCASHALSAVSDMLYDVPAWSGVEALGAAVPSYFTSTPPRRRRSARMKLRDIENNYAEATAPPIHDGNAFYQYVDLIPYPDVFDLDMYYDTTMPLRKKLKKAYNHDCNFKNTLFLDGLIDPPICERLPSDDCKEKYEMTISSVISISSPIACHERERARCDDISQSPSTQSLLKNTNSSCPPSLSSVLSRSQSQRQHRKSPHNSSNPRYIIPLDESTNTSFRTSITTSAMTSPSPTLYSIEKSTTTRVKSPHEPFRSIPALAHTGQRSRWSHYPQRSRTSSDSEPESDAGSMDALNARLKEACDGFPTPTFTKQIEIWEPISF